MSKKENGFIVTEEYIQWINDIKNKIKQSQIKAAVKVNYELLDLYWNLGRELILKQKSTKWGDSFLVTVSNDLKKSFPGVSGFSVQNLKNIRYWYRFYNESEKGLQVVSQFNIVEKMIKSIPWGHNQRIMYKCKDINEALFYVQKTIDNGWSRTIEEIENELVEELTNKKN